MGISEIWHRIEAGLAAQFPEVLATLKPGASEEEITAAETALGVHFPEDFRESLLRHNGQETYLELLGMGPLLPLEGILDQWQVWKELFDDKTFEEDGEPFGSAPAPGIKPDWWNPRWIPLTHDGAGNHDCLDLDPAEGGMAGQIIQMWHDDEQRPLTAISVTKWLTDFLEDLEAGELILTSSYGLVRKDSDLAAEDENEDEEN